MLEQVVSDANRKKYRTENPTVLRLKFFDLEAPPAVLKSTSVTTGRKGFDWGHIGVLPPTEK